MVRHIALKQILRAIEGYDNYGHVYIKYGVMEDKYEQKTVKDPVSGIGKIFPFIKRTVQKEVKVGQELVVKEISVDQARRMGDNAPQVLKDELNKTPCKRIIQLNPKIYGQELYLGHIYDEKYVILSDTGVVIGQFDMQGKGYYYPAKNGLLPKEASEANVGNMSCEPLGLEEIVTSYMAKNLDSIPEIPQSLYSRYPNLRPAIKEIVRNAKKPREHIIETELAN